jgi:hypothetical protein
MNKERFTDLVINGLERVIFEGEYGLPQNYVIFELHPKYFLQIAAGRGDLKVHCEAVGNGFLIPNEFIEENQIESLVQLGWSEAVGEENHVLELPCESIENRRNLAELFYATAEVYGANTIANVQVHIG